MRVEENCSRGVVNRKNSETQKESLKGAPRSGRKNPCASTCLLRKRRTPWASRRCSNRRTTTHTHRLCTSRAQDPENPKTECGPEYGRRTFGCRSFGDVRNVGGKSRVRRCSVASGPVTIAPGDVTQRRSKVKRQPCQQDETEAVTTIVPVNQPAIERPRLRSDTDQDSEDATPRSDRAAYPRVVVHENVVRRSVNLETGEEEIEVIDPGELAIERFSKRPARNRSYQSGNTTISTDARGRVSTKRRKRRTKLHPFLRHGR